MKKDARKKSLRDRRVSARITLSLYQLIEKFALSRKWTVSDCVEEALVLLVNVK